MQFLADLAKVLVRPAAVMARILAEGPRNAHVWLLFALSVLSGIFGDFDAPMMDRLIRYSGGVHVALIIAAVVVAVLVVLTVVCWFYAYVPMLIGRLLGGTGEIRGVRAAVAWGLAPTVWALLYRVPAAIWFAPSAATSVQMRDASVTFNPGALSAGCGVALVFVLLELIVLVWCAVVMSNTVAEAHRFSAWHALGTLVLSAIAPLVVVLAAALAMM